MIRRTLVAGLRARAGETVTIAGWVKTLRLQSTMQFMLLRDHTGTVQVTNRRGGELESLIDGLTAESAVRVTGTVVDNPVVDLGGLEIVPQSITIEGRAAAPLPVDDNTGPEHRLDWRFLDLRTHTDRRMVFDVQTTVEQAMREFAYANGCTELHTPKLMGAASESGAEVFGVGYFGKQAYLAQSPQFYKQTAIAAGIDRVFEIGPVFRAEPSFTAQHATEFISVDAELAWIDGVEDVMDFEERMLAHVLATVAQRHHLDITVPSVPFPRITMAEAQAAARSRGWDGGARDDLDRAGERMTGALIAEQTGHEFVFVTHYPVRARPFYHMRAPGNPGLTLSYDLLWKGLEITTGAQREHRYDMVVAQAEEMGLSPEPMRHYLDCFRYGCPPHGGFGLGLGRLLMTALGLESLRDATFLFRGPNRLAPLPPEDHRHRKCEESVAVATDSSHLCPSGAAENGHGSHPACWRHGRAAVQFSSGGYRVLNVAERAVVTRTGRGVRRDGGSSPRVAPASRPVIGVALGGQRCLNPCDMTSVTCPG